MPTDFQTPSGSKAMLWTGRAMSGVVLLFLVMDGATKLMMIQPVVNATAQIGYPLDLVRPIGIIGLVCAVLYAVPRTAVLGAILTTGLLGGAIASKMRLEEPLFSQVLFGVYVGVLAWGGLYLRDGRLRALFPCAASRRPDRGAHRQPPRSRSQRWPEDGLEGGLLPARKRRGARFSNSGSQLHLRLELRLRRMLLEL